MDTTSDLDAVHVGGRKCAEKTGACSTFFTRAQRGIVESVVYQLVRVEGDGRLVPATDKEVMEVEHMLESCKKELCDIEGISQQLTTEITSPKPNSKFEETSASPRNADHTKLKTDPEPAMNDSDGSRTSATDINSSPKPDFSLLKKEICLDNLTIRELQETFRAAFGRQTSVKDKLWLKRRITMGLTNSCDVPHTSFILKEQRVVKDKAAETVDSQNGSCRHKRASRSINRKHSLSAPANQVVDHQVLSGKRLRRTELDRVATDEDVQMEQVGAKRVRKPTKRYIEELSDVDTDEWRFSSTRNNVRGHSSPKAQIRQIHKFAHDNTFITRWDSLGGSAVQIPYVSRERRRRPRKDFLTLMDIPAIPRDSLVSDTRLWTDHDPDLENADPSRRSDGNSETMPTTKDVTKRKHHRAWNLTEVMKLVEGVSRYGAGKWSDIKRLAFASSTYRTSVDLKDKWRNLLKASFSQGVMEKQTHQSRKNSNAAPIPAPILVRVRELAEMQRQSGLEFGHAEQVVQETRPGFL